MAFARKFPDSDELMLPLLLLKLPVRLGLLFITSTRLKSDIITVGAV